MIDLPKFFIDVFDPQPGEKVGVLIDTPHGLLSDTPAWLQRRAMATRWHAALAQLAKKRAFDVLPLVAIPATGAHNAQLPETGQIEGDTIHLHELAANMTLLLALTEYSASAPLIDWTHRFPRLRVASMPMVAPEMEATALAADYAQLARSCERLQACLQEAEYAHLGFSNGDTLTLDLRYRKAHVDDGRLHPNKTAPRLVNLPSGEAYQALYEGERPGDPSRTAGVLPVAWRGDIVRIEIARNRVIDVLGRGEAADDLRTFLSLDSARRNVAEFGLGCNPTARVWGNVLEDEKAGPHIALGRSEHLGGTIGPDQFENVRHVWHQDFVFAKESPIHVAELTLDYAHGTTDLLVLNGHYVEALEVGV